MNKITKAFMATALATLAFGVGSFIDSQPAHAQAGATVGSLRGVIRDVGQNREPAAGATVVATSPALQGEQVVITDDTGQYFITSLPSGMYTLTVYYNDATFSRSNVLIQVGKEAVVNVNVNSKAGEGKKEVIVIKGSAPIVDQGSTKTGLTLTDDYTRNVPTGRTFGGVLGSTAGAQSDFYGISMSGATSVENTYIVEGINTTDTAYGSLSSNLPNEFISETEIITGGYNAEYGRATGGIVNVVTKQGGNEFHGSVFGYLSPSSMTAAAKVVQKEGGAVDARVDAGNDYDFGAELGGPLIKDKLWFHVGINPSVANETLTRLVQRQVDDNQDGIPDTDANGFLKHELVSQSTLPSSLKTYYFTAKLSGAVDQNNQGAVSIFGNPRSGTQSIDPASTSLTHSPEDNLLNRERGAYDVSGKWTSKLAEGKTQIDAVLGYHHGYANTTPTNALGKQALVYYGFERSLNDFADLEGSQISAKCDDNSPTDMYPGIRNCPITNYAEAGLGNLEKRSNDRTSATLQLTQRVKLLGYHTFMGGLDYQLSTYNSNSYYTGGEYLKRFADTAAGAPGRWQKVGYYGIVRNLTDAEIADPNSVMLTGTQVICSNGRAICDDSPALIADTGDRSVGAFLRDSWQVRPNLTLNFGIRFEQQQAGTAKQLQGTIAPTGETVGKVGFNLDNWAPRLGFIYDPTQEGKSKIFGHYGRFYENVPMDLNVRSFGGEIDNVALLNANRRTPTSQGYNPACNVNHAAGQDAAVVLAGCDDFQQLAILGGGTEYVTPGLKGQYTDEAILGAEYEVKADIKIGLNYIHRTMPMVIEDILTPDGSYFITNPGQDLTADAKALETKAMAEMASSDPKIKSQGDLDLYRSQQMAHVKSFDPPSRNYDALQLQVTQRPTVNSLILASYTYSQEKGNYPGLFSTETNQLDPNITSQYDLPALLANRYGPLGLDRPHLLKIDGFYMFDLKAAGLLTVGASIRAQSGIAHNALGNDPVYGQDEAYLLQRGTFSRSPLTGQGDIHLSYGRRINKTTKVEGFVNIFNLFDQQQELTADESYTFDGTIPIIGGSLTDLAHIKAHDADGVETSATPIKNPNFGKLTSYQQLPRSFQFGFRVTF
jgi:hypothetical protein